MKRFFKILFCSSLSVFLFTGCDNSSERKYPVSVDVNSRYATFRAYEGYSFRDVSVEEKENGEILISIGAFPSKD